MSRHGKRVPTHPVRRLADALGAVYAAPAGPDKEAAESALAALRRELGLRTAREEVAGDDR